MRDDLIGERCTVHSEMGASEVTLLAWWHNSSATVLHDGGQVWQVPIDSLRFQPRTEHPDELREAAEALLTLLTLDDIGGRLSGDETERLVAQLRKALQ